MAAAIFIVVAASMSWVYDVTKRGAIPYAGGGLTISTGMY